jgi:hypothetical protein
MYYFCWSQIQNHQKCQCDNAVVINISGIHFSFLFLVPFRVNVKRTQRASLQEVQTILPCREETEKNTSFFPCNENGKRRNQTLTNTAFLQLKIPAFFMARVMASSILRFLDHTQRRTTVGRTPLNEWSARRSDLYLTTWNTHNRQIFMPPAGFEPTTSTGERPQTYVLDRTANGTA